jgi:5-methylcytosine-specific restriction protein A
LNCRNCESEFHPTPNLRVYCSEECRRIGKLKVHSRCNAVEISRRDAEGGERYQKRLAYNRKYSTSEHGRIKHLAAHKRYLQTPKGQEWISRHLDTWRGRAASLIFTQNKPCAKCRETNKLILECDHILARSLGGTDDWSNLQVLCKTCHKQKTLQDLVVLRGIRCQT